MIGKGLVLHMFEFMNQIDLETTVTEIEAIYTRLVYHVTMSGPPSKSSASKGASYREGVY